MVLTKIFLAAVAVSAPLSAYARQRMLLEDGIMNLQRLWQDGLFSGSRRYLSQDTKSNIDVHAEGNATATGTTTVNGQTETVTVTGVTHKFIRASIMH
jgi:hypothetical protein